MAFVRKRGKQLVIAHGVRDPDTGKVEQQILFTIYSKAEALEALGLAGRKDPDLLKELLRDQYPDIRFDWGRIRKGIEDNIDILPDLYEYRTTRLREKFHSSLTGFARQLLLADPQLLKSAGQVVREHGAQLAFLANLINFRLRICDGADKVASEDNPFYWRFALPGTEVPAEAEEMAADLLDEGKFADAKAAFELLIECFDGYAEGHNYLGLIALYSDRYEEALEQFDRTIELGRKMFPKRLAKDRYWSVHRTRPYMRGLTNKTIVLGRLGRYEQALETASTLEDECGDRIRAEALRQSIYLNLGRLAEAAASAKFLHEIFPSSSLILALALFEQGAKADALGYLLNAAICRPWTTSILAGLAGASLPRPKSSVEAEDMQAGHSLAEDLKPFLSSEGKRAKAFVQKVLSDDRVRTLLDEMAEVRDEWIKERDPESRAAYDRMMLMRTPQFAKDRAQSLRDLVGR